jgi:hypothetical protein
MILAQRNVTELLSPVHYDGPGPATDHIAHKVVNMMVVFFGSFKLSCLTPLRNDSYLATRSGICHACRMLLLLLSSVQRVHRHMQQTTQRRRICYTPCHFAASTSTPGLDIRYPLLVHSHGTYIHP